ncbi:MULTISPECIES: FAD-dependent oxidoreductase [Paenarthrobacter]|uniref:FAD-dependent oxidoreductase n=1 Tax=Paenarthrobacter TaxID=1742992 RepID=UPI00074D2D3F|nr:FAD-dependent oxidoreductase [Paenarthrobacter ureafaciens]AMB40346.1 FAD-dependent oxidoreductase [Arthrobacter sp. ATCC 21022]KUR63549.1 FAD-dependent oxidoreductase [Arthrobacter sp. ATCC 21022]RWW91507.1 FAD-dependent oxidoreductase [Paenarthrobacter ureafaciens]
MTDVQTDVLIVGGGLGGVAAALAALKAGRHVVLTEQYPWLGGQLTSQAVPMDEHRWVEQFGVTASYRKLRNGIRDYYRNWYPLTEEARGREDLNPGAGTVSAVCAEPRVAVAVIDAMLSPFTGTGRLTVIQPAVPVGAEMDGNRIKRVTVRSEGTSEETVISAHYVLDATETGDLLPFVGAEYVVGAESRHQTGEPSAPETPDPDNVQALSWCFVIDHVEGNHVIDKPRDYEYWRKYQPEFWGAPMLSLTGPRPQTLETLTRTFTPDIDDEPLETIGCHGPGNSGRPPGDRELWTFRRILARKLFREGHFDSDLVLVNWPMIDYLDGSIIDNPGAEKHLEAARQLSYSMFYWLQTEAPRPDGGKGWPGLRLRGDITGTRDGLAQAPYIRESRRIKAEYTVVEGDLSLAVRGHGAPTTFPDSVGVGMYRIDLHPSTGGDNYVDVASAPFEIPLGSFIPVRLENLLPAGKNIGTTHITNGAFRLHPVEWNIGEVAGWLASFCLANSTDPRTVRNTPHLLEEFQNLLTREGVELHWPDVTGY